MKGKYTSKKRDRGWNKIEIRKVNNIDNNLTKVFKSISKLNKLYESCDEKFKLVPGATWKKNSKAIMQRKKLKEQINN